MSDRTYQMLAYIYYEEEPGRPSAANLLSKDEARRIAVNIAKLPEKDAIVTLPGTGLAPKR